MRLRICALYACIFCKCMSQCLTILINLVHSKIFLYKRQSCTMNQWLNIYLDRWFHRWSYPVGTMPCHQTSCGNCRTPLPLRNEWCGSWNKDQTRESHFQISAQRTDVLKRLEKRQIKYVTTTTSLYGVSLPSPLRKNNFENHFCVW